MKLGVTDQVQPWSFYESNMRITNSEAKKKSMRWQRVWPRYFSALAGVKRKDSVYTKKYKCKGSSSINKHNFSAI